MLKRLLLVAVIAAVGWWFWTQRGPGQSYKKLSVQLEIALNQQLTLAQITDKDVLHSLRQEKSRFGIRWIQSERRMRVNFARLPTLLSRITDIAEQMGCVVLKRTDTPNRVVLELGKGPYLMQHLEFEPMQAMARRPEVAIVIDDVAYDLDRMDRFAELGVTLTFAILPRDRRSKDLADKAIKLHFPVIVHMPMEPKDLKHNDPGPAGLYLKMNEQQLHQQFEKNIASVPHIQGINNHMGSAFTEDPEKMRWVLNWVKEKKLFFLDSNTSPHSVVRKVAKEVGVPCLINETFLDNQDETVAIEKQLDIVLKLALQRKQTIAIGHYRRKYLVEALARKLPEFQAKGVSFVGLPEFYPPS